MAKGELVGYDPRSHHSVRFRGGIEVQEESSMPPDAVVASIECADIAVYYLSGITDPAIVCVDDRMTLTYYRDSQIRVKDAINPMYGLIPICIGGEVSNSPEGIAYICNAYPNTKIFVSPIINELYAIGAVVDKERPTREFIAKPNKESLDAESLDYWDASDGDKYGKMARQVFLGNPVYNDIYTGIGKTKFYGSVISAKYTENCVVMISSRGIDRYFPETPISAKCYAATSVPVSMKAPDKFREEVMDVSHVNVMVASDFIPGSSTFMNYYKLASGKDWVCLSDRIEGKSYNVFRYDKVYKQ